MVCDAILLLCWGNISSGDLVHGTKMGEGIFHGSTMLKPGDHGQPRAELPHICSQSSKPGDDVLPVVLRSNMCPMPRAVDSSDCARCPKPVISAIHSACVGGGVDLVCATDIRLASSDAWFCIKEVRVVQVFGPRIIDYVRKSELKSG